MNAQENKDVKNTEVIAEVTEVTEVIAEVVKVANYSLYGTPALRQGKKDFEGIITRKMVEIAKLTSIIGKLTEDESTAVSGMLDNHKTVVKDAQAKIARLDAKVLQNEVDDKRAKSASAALAVDFLEVKLTNKKTEQAKVNAEVAEVETKISNAKLLIADYTALVAAVLSRQAQEKK